MASWWFGLGERHIDVPGTAQVGSYTPGRGGSNCAQELAVWHAGELLKIHSRTPTMASMSGYER